MEKAVLEKREKAVKKETRIIWECKNPDCSYKPKKKKDHICPSCGWMIGARYR